MFKDKNEAKDALSKAIIKCTSKMLDNSKLVEN